MNERAYLDCDHCGAEAIESADGTFGDGDGGKCMTCGFPGCVSVDDSGDMGDATAYWSCSEADDAVCNEADCESCEEFRKTRAEKP